MYTKPNHFIESKKNASSNNEKKNLQHKTLITFNFNNLKISILFIIKQV